MNKMNKRKNKTYTVAMMNKRENMTEARGLVAVFLKKGGKITSYWEHTHRFKTFKR